VHSSADPYDLERFVDAQADVYPNVITELASGVKRSHWMWFVFPQIAGLGSSPTAQRYAISSLGEAAAYAAHPLLGPRLVECTGLVVAIDGRSLEQIFGWPDHLKFHSSMTLFSLVPHCDGVFHAALTKYFGGRRDGKTMELV
jgi:uncharacterized protein (DUF1810 family)